MLNGLEGSKQHMAHILRDSASYKEMLKKVEGISFDVDALYLLWRHRRGWFASWVYSGMSIEDALTMVNDLAGKVAQVKHSSDPVRTLDSFVSGWANRRVVDDLSAAEAAWIWSPRLRLNLAREAPFEDIHLLAADAAINKRGADWVQIAQSLSMNPSLTREAAIMLTHCDSIDVYMSRHISEHLDIRMRYQFLYDNYSVSKFNDEIEQVDSATFESLKNGWVGSLEDLLAACAALGQD